MDLDLEKSIKHSLKEFNQGQMDMFEILLFKRLNRSFCKRFSSILSIKLFSFALKLITHKG